MASVTVRLTKNENGNVTQTSYAMTFSSGTTWTRTFTYAQLGSPLNATFTYEFRATDGAPAANTSAFASNPGWTFGAGECFI